LNQYAEAERVLTEVVALNQKVFGPESHDPACIAPIGNLANAKDGLGKLSEAESLHTQAVQMKTAIYGHSHPSTHLSMRNLYKIQQKIRVLRGHAGACSGPSCSAGNRRFRVGDRVLCSMDGWSPGVVVALDYSEPHWPHSAPYQVKLDNGLLICAPADHDRFIRPADSSHFQDEQEAPSEANIGALESMGFTRVQASTALRACGNNVAAAVEMLLSGEE
jgi:hypothetical protein